MKYIFSCDVLFFLRGGIMQRRDGVCDACGCCDGGLGFFARLCPIV